jgi:hypothetical protein
MGFSCQGEIFGGLDGNAIALIRYDGAPILR